MGMNSGEVVVGKIGDDLRMDYTAQGHVVGVAARMEQLAEPGKVCLADGTAKRVVGYFELEDLGPARLSGMREPIQVFELQGVGQLRTRLDVSRMRGFSRFVGRAEEMQTLEAALVRAREREAQVIGIVGEAGTGKSRLCFEFLERCRTWGLASFEAHGVAHGRATPLVPILELFRSYFGIKEQDSDQIAREKIAGRLLLLDDAFREVLPLQFEFLGVADPEHPATGMEPETRQGQLFSVMKRVVQLGGREQTTITLLEDLHWFDGGSDAFVEQLVDAVQGTHSLLIVNFRPEYHADWMRKSYYQQVPLLPLSPEATQELLGNLLGADPSLGGLPERIHDRARGNPFFIEEVVQSLAESGQLQGSRGAYRLREEAAQIAVPDTVQAVLSARIDRLAERERRVLRTAAVIGKAFSESVLTRVIGFPENDLRTSLETLKRGEFIFEESVYPEFEYAFKHPLTQEVAYGSQLGERKQSVHAAVARAMTELGSGRLDERAALLAHHWEAAGESLEAARWQRRAADWAGTRDGAAALRHWRRVRELLVSVPESDESLWLTLAACIRILWLGWWSGLPVEEAPELIADGRALASRLSDERSLALLLANASFHLDAAGKRSTARAYAKEALDLVSRLGDLGLSARIATLALPGFRESVELRSLHESVLDAVKTAPHRALKVVTPRNYSLVLARESDLLAMMGRLDEAKELADEAVAVAREHGAAGALGVALWSRAKIAEFHGDLQLALHLGRESIAMADHVEHSRAKVTTRVSLLLNCARVGRRDRADAVLEELSSSLGGRVPPEPFDLSGLAEAHLELGNFDQAQALAEDAAAGAHSAAMHNAECDALLVLARARMATEGVSAGREIESILGHAQECAASAGSAVRLPGVHLARAEFARLRGDGAARERELREAHRLFAEMGATARAEQVARELSGDPA
jgi:adenylate cyclase